MRVSTRGSSGRDASCWPGRPRDPPSPPGAGSPTGTCRGRACACGVSTTQPALWDAALREPAARAKRSRTPAVASTAARPAQGAGAQFPDLSFHPRLRGRYGPLGRTRRICLAFSFGGGRLGQHRPGELPRLSHREACPPGTFAARALPEADEDPRGGMTRIAEREPADREFPPAARTQVLVPSIGTRARIWTWPHHAPPGFRPAAAAYTPAGLGNNRGAVIPACARHSPNRPGSPGTIRRRPVRAGRRGPGTPAAR